MFEKNDGKLHDEIFFCLCKIFRCSKKEAFIMAERYVFMQIHYVGITCFFYALLMSIIFYVNPTDLVWNNIKPTHFVCVIQ